MKLQPNKWMHFFSNLKLKKKLLVSYFILILLPLGILSYFTYDKVTDILKNYVMMSTKQAFDQTSSFISYKLYRILKVSDVIAVDKSVNDILEKNPDSYMIQDQIVAMGTLKQYLSSFQDPVDVLGVRLYVSPGFLFSNEHVNIYSLEEVSNQRWYQEVQKSNNKITWIPSSSLEGDSYSNEKILTAARNIKNLDNYQENVGILRVDFSEKNIRDILSKANTLKNSLSFIQTSNGNLVTASNESLFNTYVKDNSFLNQMPDNPSQWTTNLKNGEKVYIQSLLIPETNWYMVIIVPFQEFLSESAKLRNDILVLMLVVGSFAYILAYYISGSITKRVSRLKIKMREVQKGVLNPITEPLNMDEIGELTSDFNYMVSRISTLMEEQYRTGQALKSAELKALQAQINPHFLYNTLDLINWMAPKQMIQETRNVVQALAKFYKLSLSKGKDIITIQEEIELTLSYMQIQNMRFYNKLNLYIAIDDQIGEYNIPKITLQPIVENAILHGILAKDNQEGTILIEGKMENNVITLSVKDDGIGITADRLNELLTNKLESKNGSGFGILNINERIKLLYGDEYGVIVRSEYGKSTTVEIRIPAYINSPKP